MTRPRRSPSVARPDARTRAIGTTADERPLVVAIALLVAVTAVIISPSGKDAFRLVKVLAAGWLGLVSLLIVAWPLRHGGSIDPRSRTRRLTLRAALPLTAVVLLGALWTTHRAHYVQSATDFLIAVACLIGWSLALSVGNLERVLRWTIPPAVLIALLTIDQALGLTGLLDGLGIQAPSARLALTATLGNPGDVAAYLVLPSLLLVVDADGTLAERPWRWPAAGVMAVALAATATLTALAAVGVGLIVVVVSLRQRGNGLSTRALTIAAGAIALAGAVAVAAPPLRARIVRGWDAIAARDLNALLTGRLDGWRVAISMLEHHPAAGVGQGGFVPEFAAARLALMDRGTTFYPEQTQTIFATPHNEWLSVAAEQGWPGLLALLWGVACVVRAAARTAGRHRALAWSGLAALTLLTLTWFPFHAAAIAWPWLAWIAWLDRAGDSEAAS